MTRFDLSPAGLPALLASVNPGSVVAELCAALADERARAVEARELYDALAATAGRVADENERLRAIVRDLLRASENAVAQASLASIHIGATDRQRAWLREAVDAEVRGAGEAARAALKEMP